MLQRSDSVNTALLNCLKQADAETMQFIGHNTPCFHNLVRIFYSICESLPVVTKQLYLGTTLEIYLGVDPS